MSRRRDRSKTRGRSVRRRAPRRAGTYGQRSHPPRPRGRPAPQGPPWGIIIGVIAAIIILGGVGAFLIIRILTTAEPTPTPTSTISPSRTTLPGAGSSPSPARPTRTPEASPTPVPVASPTPPPLNLSDLQRLMITLVNEDRTAAGLEPVVWDQAAGLAAQSHAEEMARFGYLSHWNLDGHGPAYRYSQVGGVDAVQENVYSFWYRYDDGRPAPIESWEAVVRQAQAELMGSPGHRANILTPEHTNVGIGIAYEPQSGDVRLAQLFVNRYVQLVSVPIQATLSQQITLQGRLEPEASNPLLNLAYEAFPEPMSVSELNETSTFTSQAEIYDSTSLVVEEDGRFHWSVVLDKEGQPGLYSVRIWVTTKHGEVLATEVVIVVR